MELKNEGASNLDINLGELVEKIKQDYGDIDLNLIKLKISYNQFKCLGYDLYDSSDYGIFVDIIKE
jgi:hypothetical protein